MERELRRYQNLLVCVGSGTIMFGFWSFIKGVMTMILYKKEIGEFLIVIGATENQLEYLIPMVNIIITMIVCIDLVFRLIVGLSARNEGKARDQKKRWAYLAVGVVLLFLSVSSFFSDLSSFFSEYTNFFDGIITVAIDVTSIVMLVELFVAGVKVKYLRKKLREKKAEEVMA